ncbi:MAG: hypothetical protein GY715_14000 [Planctomycetes bacterium]|nr:hypothetical protein [Planctomycetota bacterium]
MASPASPIMVMDRGDLPSLTALLIEPDPSRVVLWHAPEGGPAGFRRQQMVRAHAGRFEVRELVIAEPWELPVLEGDSTVDLEETGGRRRDDPGHLPEHLAALTVAPLLVQAVLAGHLRGCGRVVWPVQVGPNAPLVGRAVECASVASELVEIAAAGHGDGPGAFIDLPLVDLSDEQVAELAEDAGLPPDGFWPCVEGAATPCEADADFDAVCPGCRRWQEALERIGQPWPWQAARA